MATISISASMQRACSSSHVTKKQQPLTRTARSVGTKQVPTVVTLNVDGPKSLDNVEQEDKSSLLMVKSKDAEDVLKQHDADVDSSVPKFIDERWKKGTWDLNMFVKDGRMDWDGLIVAEARRRRILELYPEAATNQEPVLFRSSIIPWWAWIRRSYLPEAELLNGRAAMVGFFMAYIVDALTGLDMVGQTGNFVCKAGLLVTVLGVILFRQTQDLKNLKSLADEATLYDKQWQAAWQDQNPNVTNSGKKI